MRLAALPSGKFVTFNSATQAICLPEPSQQYTTGMQCTITGWGSQNSQTNGTNNTTLRNTSKYSFTGYPPILQAASVPILASEECRKPQVYGSNLSPSAFCAGFLNGGVDSCQGDSGGPFACEIQG